jgi:hypothetical protein
LEALVKGAVRDVGRVGRQRVSARSAPGAADVDDEIVYVSTSPGLMKPSPSLSVKSVPFLPAEKGERRHAGADVETGRAAVAVAVLAPRRGEVARRSV